jgi:hypothetical protein
MADVINTNKNIDPSHPCPTCGSKEVERWWASELGEDQKGCRSCKYTDASDNFDFKSMNRKDPIGTEITNLIPPQADARKFSEKRLREMETHDTLKVDVTSEGWQGGKSYLWVTRVPGGWIYHNGAMCAFVPDLQESPERWRR